MEIKVPSEESNLNFAHLARRLLRPFSAGGQQSGKLLNAPRLLRRDKSTSVVGVAAAMREQEAAVAKRVHRAPRASTQRTELKSAADAKVEQKAL